MISLLKSIWRGNSREANYVPIDHDDLSGIVLTDDDAEFGGREAREVLEKKLLRKLDIRMSILIIIYILNYIDRNNAAAARLRGFEEDLHLVGRQFDMILSSLYVGYILMQVPSNLLLNRMGRPSIYLPSCMVVWGMISILTGFTHNFTGALVARFFLGFVEAAFYPGALFLLSKWYKRRELGLRTTLLSCGSMISNATGALLASAILDTMDGIIGGAAWRWLFYIEGTLTVAVAIAAFSILPDFPENSSFLTPLEQRLALRRLTEDGITDEIESKSDSLSGLFLAFSDGKVWWLAVLLFFMVLGLSFNMFFPTLCATFGYGTPVTLLLCAPPWIIATVVAFANNMHSDKMGERFYHIVCPLVVGMVGFAISLSTLNNIARYIALILMAQSYAGSICFFAWASNSISHPASKRAVALAFINAFSQLGNVAGSYVWPKYWEPRYAYSYMICMTVMGLAIAMAWLFRQHLRSLNESLEECELQEGSGIGYRYLL